MGREIIQKALKLQPVDRIPWVPFTGVHAASLIGATAEEYLKSSDLIVQGITKAVELYKPDGIPVIFDLQIEAEVLGCQLKWDINSPPSVVSHPLLTGMNLDDLKVPCACKGRIPIAMDATRKLRDLHPDLALYGLITGPFTLALHLLGTDIFMKMFEDPDEVHKLMRFSTEVGKMMSMEYIQAGCDVIAMVDPMTSQIDPISFETFVSPYASELFSFISENQALSSFFVCGNAIQNIEAMCLCKPDNISIDENIPLDYVRDTALARGISFGGNIKLTVSLLMGNEDDCRRDALACMDTGGKCGFILAPGCDLAFDTPAKNIEAVAELVYNEILQGELRASAVEAGSFETIDLKDHWSNNKVVIDIITLDSGSCAPCQYMVDAVERAAAGFTNKVITTEHKITTKQGIQMMATLGVKNLPTIVMDGNVEFISQIPPVEHITGKILEYLAKKQ